MSSEFKNPFPVQNILKGNHQPLPIANSWITHCELLNVFKYSTVSFIVSLLSSLSKMTVPFVAYCFALCFLYMLYQFVSYVVISIIFTLYHLIFNLQNKGILKTSPFLCNSRLFPLKPLYVYEYCFLYLKFSILTWFIAILLCIGVITARPVVKSSYHYSSKLLRSKIFSRKILTNRMQSKMDDLW